MKSSEAATAAAFMARALRLAERGRRSTHPNPRVGCVIVQRGRVVGEGFHERAGGAHAEIVALKAAGALARNADVYLTLEPCCHQGRTGPCTESLIRAGVKRVVAAMEDPNPLVGGQGLAALRGAGIDTDVGLMEEQAEALNRGFVSRMTRQRPWITLKLAASLDGRTAMASGESRWITGPEARADVHRLRAEAGAVLTTVNTVIADDPELTVRTEGARVRQPDRIVLDTHLRSPPQARVWASGARRILITVRPRSDHAEALQERGVEVSLVPIGAGSRIALPEAMQALARLEVNEVLVECGPTFAGALLRADLVDELVCYTAPALLGDEARPLARLPGLAQLDQRVRLEFVDVRRIGADLRITARPAAAPPLPGQD